MSIALISSAADREYLLDANDKSRTQEAKQNSPRDESIDRAVKSQNLGAEDLF